MTFLCQADQLLHDRFKGTAAHGKSIKGAISCQHLGDQAVLKLTDILLKGLIPDDHAAERKIGALGILCHHQRIDPSFVFECDLF